jgi:uncharacterized protein YbjT (DUF2867 family)
MATIVSVAGSSGDLGGRLIRALAGRGAQVRALVRPGIAEEKLQKLKIAGVTITPVDFSKPDDLKRALEGSSCVVSTLAGLREVIVDAQTALLGAALEAGVPRFIPSDFASDFRTLPAKENRNFDLRREFDARLDESALKATSIFNGAFAELLQYGIPLFDLRARRVGYFGDASWPVDFSTKDDTANFTAAAALDPTTPRALCIASFQLTPTQLAAMSGFELVRLGSLEELSAANKQQRAANPQGEHEVYARWQQSQYFHSMLCLRMDVLDNARYPELKWAEGNAFIAAVIARSQAGRP